MWVWIANFLANTVPTLSGITNGWLAFLVSILSIAVGLLAWHISKKRAGLVGVTLDDLLIGAILIAGLCHLIVAGVLLWKAKTRLANEPTIISQSTVMPVHDLKIQNMIEKAVDRQNNNALAEKLIYFRARNERFQNLAKSAADIGQAKLLEFCESKKTDIFSGHRSKTYNSTIQEIQRHASEDFSTTILRSDIQARDPAVLFSSPGDNIFDSDELKQTYRQFYINYHNLVENCKTITNEYNKTIQILNYHIQEFVRQLHSSKTSI